MAALEPPKLNVVDAGDDPGRPRASSVGHRHNTRRIRRSSGTYRSPFSPGEEEDPTALYCVCRQSYDGSRNMIACDRCEDWFHPECVGITDLKKITPETPYFCPNCEKAPTPARPRSSSSAAVLIPELLEEGGEGGRPRSASQSRKKPKKSPRSLLAISADAASLAADDAMMSGLGGNAPIMPSPAPRGSPAPTSSRPIRRATLERYNPHEMSCSLPAYIHGSSSSSRSRAHAHAGGMDLDHHHHHHHHHSGEGAMTTGKLSRHRSRLVDGQETDDTEFSEMDPGRASPSDHFLRTRTRRRGTPSLPGLEKLSIHGSGSTSALAGSDTSTARTTSAAAAAHQCNAYCNCRETAAAPAREEGDHKRVFHNERERARRSTIRTMFETLRKSVPAVEVFENSSDRHILEEAARHIHQLTDEGRELEKGVMRLRVENLQLKLANLPPGSPASQSLTAQLAAAVAAYESCDISISPHRGGSFIGEHESTEGSSPLSGLSPGGMSPPEAPHEDDGVGISTAASSNGCQLAPPEHKDDLMSLLRIAAEEYAQAQAQAQAQA